MSMTLSPDIQARIQTHMRTGGYATPDELLTAALAALDQQMRGDGFAPGELDELLAIGDAEIERGEVVDGKRALEDRRRRRAEEARKAG